MKKFFQKHKKRKIIAIVILAVVLLLGGIYGSLIWSVYRGMAEIVPADEVDSKAKNVKIAQEDTKDEDVVNILLVGTDSRDPNADMGRSDSMMLVSFNNKEQKITAVSFLRDTLVEIDGYGQTRLGHAYAYGGVGLLINTLNKTYNLDIQNYITINFDNLINIIDEIGGVPVYITEEEAEYYRQNGMPDIQSGEMTLTGSQALAHARNRTLGNDFERTRRQRNVIYGIYQKIMADKNPANLLPLVNFSMGQVQTNMGVTDIYNLAKEVLGTDNLNTQQASVPNEGTFADAEYEGMAVLQMDQEANRTFLENLLY